MRKEREGGRDREGWGGEREIERDRERERQSSCKDESKMAKDDIIEASRIDQCNNIQPMQLIKI